MRLLTAAETPHGFETVWTCSERIRIDCVRNEPQSYPLVGQALPYNKKISFWEHGVGDAPSEG